MSAVAMARAMGFASPRSSIARRERGRPTSFRTSALVRPWYARLWMVNTVAALRSCRERAVIRHVHADVVAERGEGLRQGARDVGEATDLGVRSDLGGREGDAHGAEG